MLSAKQAALAIRILLLSLVAALSIFVAAQKLPDTGFVQESLASVEASSDTVMKFSAATLATSLAISALPDDFATPLADSLADMNIYFVGILVVLLLEKLLILYGMKMAFGIAVPLACLVGAVAVWSKKHALKNFAVRICALGLAVAFVVPCSTHLTKVVASDMRQYVETTIQETESGANKLNEATQGNTEEQNMFEKLSDLFQTAIRDISDLLLHFRNSIRSCMNSIAILILTDCVIPVLTFFVLKWVLKETFQIVIPMPAEAIRRHLHSASAETESECSAVGE